MYIRTQRDTLSHKVGMALRDQAKRVIASCDLILRYDEAFIWGVYVSESLRNKRIGELLMIQTLLTAHKHGKHDVGLNVFRDNHAANKLYTKVGFGDYHGNSIERRVMLTDDHVRKLRCRRRQLQRRIRTYQEVF